MSEEFKNEHIAGRDGPLRLTGIGAVTPSASSAKNASAAGKTLFSDFTILGLTTVAGGTRLNSTDYEFFNPGEYAFIESAVETLIPADIDGPGASELGVAAYIDRQMIEDCVESDRLYPEGSFGGSAQRQDYRLSMTDSDLIRVGIAAVNNHTLNTYRKTFDALSAERRLAVMLELDRKKICLPDAPTEAFFKLLLQLTIEGYLADPMHDNHDKASWKIFSFPGASAIYARSALPDRAPYSRIYGDSKVSFAGLDCHGFVSTGLVANEQTVHRGP